MIWPSNREFKFITLNIGLNGIKKIEKIYLKLVHKWTSAGKKDMISLNRNRAMCRQLQIIKKF